MSSAAAWPYWWRGARTPGPFLAVRQEAELSDYVRREGVEYVVLAHWRAGAAEAYNAATAFGVLTGGDVSFDARTSLGRVRVAGGTVTLNRDGPTAMSALFGTDGHYPDSRLDLQTAAGRTVYSFSAAGNGFGRWTGGGGGIAASIRAGSGLVLAVYV